MTDSSGATVIMLPSMEAEKEIGNTIGRGFVIFEVKENLGHFDSIMVSEPTSLCANPSYCTCFSPKTPSRIGPR